MTSILLYCSMFL